MEQEATTLDNSIESLKDTLTSAVGDLTTYKENLDSSQDSSYIEYINSLQDAYSNILVVERTHLKLLTISGTPIHSPTHEKNSNQWLRPEPSPQQR